MTERIKTLRDYIVPRRQKERRKADFLRGFDPSVYRYSPDLRLRSSQRLRCALEAETPVILDGEKIVFLRTVPNLPDILSETEQEEFFRGRSKHELGFAFNIAPDYAALMSEGLSAVRERYSADEPTVIALDAVMDFAEKYRRKAEELGRTDIADALNRIPAKPPRSFYEALLFLRLLHYVIWVEGSYHVILGRFDQYMYPYLKSDLEKGLSRAGALELLEEFFLGCNKDSDLYPGMQQGDNGQSIVLGGYSPDGEDMYNVLSELVIEASLDLKVIDPKINLRVGAKTPIERYVFATKLTAAGLGFPQYENDDVIAPGLVKLGYSKEDACDYCVAACWEFIVPYVGADIPNIDALSFVACVNDAVKYDLQNCGSYEEFIAAAEKRVAEEAKAITRRHDNIRMRPAPFMSLMFREKKTNDIADGAKYNNYGIHGTGLAPAADSLIAVKKTVFEEKTLTPEQLNDALDHDFSGYEDIRHQIKTDKRKFGNGEPESDEAARRLLYAFSDALNGIKNDRGGIWRAGTGSAMYYVTHGKTGASPDGRLSGGFLPANYSPSIGLKPESPLSVIRSFTSPDLTRAINGGPLTLEFDSGSVRGEDGITKIAQLVRSFVLLGGHQLQLNVIDRNRLLDARRNPENHKNLVVRVWGWSGYFVELDRCYQDQILERAEMTP
ncbi:MAG: pyruvate formate-lyase [Clostridiales bacterium]|nr:pyruvate formate-lyase [Clostridiales bacterium]